MSVLYYSYMKDLNPFVLALTIAVGGTFGASGGPAPNYWCTWATQGATLGRNVKAGKVAFAGDQGVPLQRDNLNEEVLFGADGWAKRFYPNDRGDLYLLLDAGWDLPYGTETHGADLALRGACIPDAARFPSLKGMPAERLKALNAKAKVCGWRGIGVWLPSHTQGETPGKDGRPGHRLSMDEMRKVWTEKLRICREAGVCYWKVDWGLRTWDCSLRGLMTELKNEIHPALTIEHCWVPGVPLNGIRISQGGKVEGPGRLFGYDVWAKKRDDQLKTLAVSDVFRTYDVIAPFEKATTLERCAYYSKLAEERKLPVLFNVEDEPLIGAGLGHVLGIMSSGAAGTGVVTNDACVALAWQKLAPPFGHDTAAVTHCADETLEDVWTYSDKDCSWFTAAARKTIRQSAPAVVTRGLPLPTVKADGQRPFVCGARYPNGALALSFLPRTTGGRRGVECPADVTLDAKLEPGKPLGLFGAFKSVTLTGGVTKGVRIRARQLPYGKPRDVTALCRVAANGAVVIPGDVQEKPRGAYTPNVVLETVPPCVDPVAFVKDALARGERIVNVPKGEYRLPYDKDARAYFALKDVADVTVDFGGSKLIGLVRTRMFDFEGCTNLTVRNVTVDYAELPFTQATIEKVDAEGNWDVRIVDGYPRPEGRQLDEGLCWPIQAYGRETHELVNPMRFRDGIAIARTGADTYRITGGANRTGAVGDIAVWSVKDVTHRVEVSALKCLRCTACRFEDITEYATPHGCAFEDYFGDANTYLRCRIVRCPPEEDLVPRGMKRLRSGNHDANMHRGAIRGPRILDCESKYHCDDCVNISGMYGLVTESKGDELRILVNYLGLSIDDGDTCQVMTYDGVSLPDVKVLKVVADGGTTAAEKGYMLTLGFWPGLEKSCRRAYRLKLEKPLDLPRGSVIISNRHQGNGFVVRGCDFGHNRARGLLIKASGGTIESNRLERCHGAGIQIATEYQWMEGGCSRDLIVRGNVLKGNGSGIDIGGNNGARKRLPVDSHRDLTVTDNRIEGVRGGVTVVGCRGLTLGGNDIRLADPRAQKVSLANVESVSTASRCERTAHGVRLVRDGRTVWEFSSAGGKPCVHPLALPDGALVTASEDTDHPWHRGLWFCWKFLNGVNYWETDSDGRSAGEQRIVSEDVTCEGAAATVRMAVAWGPRAEPGRGLLDERREIAFSAPDAAGGYTVTWTAKFTARERTTIDRTPPTRNPKTGFWRGGYAGFSLRLADFARSCRLVSSSGAEEQADVVAREKKWIDYVNPQTGAGIRLEILKAPGRRVFYHWQDRRFTNLSPVFDGPIVLEPGETLELAYRATIHP